MGFFDTLGSLGKAIGKAAVDGIEKFQANVERQKEDFRHEYRYDDQRLINIHRDRSESKVWRAAAMGVLKERGYRLMDDGQWIKH